jgi:hypothetical protein
VKLSGCTPSLGACKHVKNATNIALSQLFRHVGIVGSLVARINSTRDLQRKTATKRMADVGTFEYFG